MPTELSTHVEPARMSLVATFASRMGIDPERMLPTLKATAFRTEKPITNEQMAALLIVATQYGLNPFTRELFAFPDKAGGIVPYISIDGWARIVNTHPAFDGMEFHYDDDQQAYTCTIHRKDRKVPTSVTEYMAECKRNTDPWNRSARRMLRHKSMMQCARVAFGFAGIYDMDEAEVISGHVVEPPAQSAQRVRAALGHRPPPPPEPEADPIDPLPSLEQVMREVTGATDPETAGLAMDEARQYLAPDELEQLAAVYRETWNKEQAR